MFLFMSVTCMNVTKIFTHSVSQLTPNWPADVPKHDEQQSHNYWHLCKAYN